ncbi:MAG: hypothetical protein KGN84_01125 [Acidobacteriota bacterium]|nr:hypothetical protein [Acidobacteriota bacterium]
MSHARGERASEHIRRELIEADFEAAFHLTDLVETDRKDGGWGTRAVSDAEEVLRDIERRLEMLGASDRLPFDTLLGELRRQIALAKSRVG